jgi:hypothetical protein
MAMVRCPKHKIPYNDDNPRGCPACAREKQGGRASDVMVMQELARASQMIRRPSGAQLPPENVDTPVTQRPRAPVPRFTAMMRALQFLRQKTFLTVAGGLVALLGVILFAMSGPRFSVYPSPAMFTGVVRPIPASPNDPVPVLFSAIGPQTPQPNPQARELQRYSYGTDFIVEAQNGVIYAVTFAVTNRSWRGIRIGMDSLSAVGTLALLGTPSVDTPIVTRGDTIAGYIVYRSADQRPRRTLRAEVRPPNNCYDVEVDLQLRQIGTLRVRDRVFSVVGEVGGAPPDWVVTRVRAVSRAMPGPYGGEPVC